jgi:hypothetical protein
LIIETGHNERGSPITKPAYLFERQLHVVEPMKISPIDDGRAKVGAKARYRETFSTEWCLESFVARES